MLLTILSLVGMLTIAYLLFVNFYPSFGGDVDEERQKLYSTSTQFEKGVFKNDKDVKLDLGLGQMLRMSKKFFFEKVENGRPKKDLPVQKLDSAQVTNYKGDTRLFWYGHSAFLLQTEGLNFLIDPMFGNVAAPHPWLGENRFNKQMPLAIAQLPKIDAVIISHDHYDHLDFDSIKKLKDKVDHYFVPLGVGVHLEAWGIASNQITELDWWQESKYKGIQFICTPAQHFSGRKFNNRQGTLWASWVINTSIDTIFFSGDSGYGDHFKDIGKKYGPFDFAMMECGQYNEMWSEIHMMPEETAQAGIDIQARKLMPIHWGSFKLALHSWTDPVVRVGKKAEALKLPLVIPKIGEAIMVKDSVELSSTWWNKL